MTAAPAEIRDHAAIFRKWLRDHALPLWCGAGFSEAHGFYELLDKDGAPVLAPVRARVNPRQAYCFAEAGRRGWDGDWQAVALAGLERMERVYRRGDDLYGNLATVGGDLIDPRFDLYNHAFMLLGQASVAAAMPEKRQALFGEATALLERLRQQFARSAAAGFEEANPPIVPLRSNPHMHLFEAAQAWASMDGVDAAPFVELADEIRDLALTHFIDQETGVLREFFDRDWRPMPDASGRIVEPGHQFEWAWLLARWARGKPEEARILTVARRLFEIGEAHGVDAARGVAVMAMDDCFTVTEPAARLWAQTEWLKAAMLLAALSEGPERQRYLESAGRSAAVLARFLDVAKPGLWFDRMEADGRLVDEPSPASSFYHIVCAIHELQGRLDEIDGEAP